jgi:Kef-type K+ transport system membrane component KefB
MVQYPVVLELGFLAGLSVPDAILAAAALTSCSLSMAYLGWKHYPGLPGASRGFVVQIMIALEVLAILILSVGSVGSDHGSGWLILFKLAGMAVTVYLIGRFAAHMVKMFELFNVKNLALAGAFFGAAAAGHFRHWGAVGAGRAEDSVLSGPVHEQGGVRGEKRGRVHFADQPRVFDPGVLCVAGLVD